MTKFSSNRPVKSTLTACQSLVKPALSIRISVLRLLVVCVIRLINLYYPMADVFLTDVLVNL